MRALVAVLVLAGPLFAERVTFATSDGQPIVGTWNPAGKDAPTVICLPMYRDVRKSYEPMVAPLILKGINVMSIDLRGHGESAPQLADRVTKRDPAVFNAMHLDVRAAIDFLETHKGCDRTRIGLIGASVGCSVAIDATCRDPGAVRAVVLLTPGSDYLGVDSLAHLKDWPGTRSFVFVSSEEKETSDAVMDALDPFDGSNHLVVPGKGIHGTRMFGKVNQIEELIANFFEGSLLGKVDLRLREGMVLRRASKETTAALGFGPQGISATVPDAWKGSVIFRVGKESQRVPLDSQKATFALDGLIGVRFPMKAEPGTEFDVEFRTSTGKQLRFPQKGRYVVQPIRESSG